MSIRDDVYAVCDRLRAAGVTPTLARVREELGSGSFSTLSPIVKEWRDGGQMATVAVLAALPDNVDVAIKQAGQLIWRAATELMATELAAIKAEHAKVVMALTNERDEAMAEIVRLERDQQLLATKMEECKRLDLQAHKLQVSLDYSIETSKAALDKADARVRELELMLMQSAPSILPVPVPVPAKGRRTKAVATTGDLSATL